MSKAITHILITFFTAFAFSTAWEKSFNQGLCVGFFVGSLFTVLHSIEGILLDALKTIKVMENSVPLILDALNAGTGRRFSVSSYMKKATTHDQKPPPTTPAR